MAHRSLWLTVCGIVLLCVAVPHASCHPRPVDSRHEIMPYYQQAEQPKQYYRPDDKDVGSEEDVANEKINLQDFEPVLKDTITYLQNVFLDPLLSGASPLDYLRTIWTTRPQPLTLPGKLVEQSVRGWILSLLVVGFIYTIYVIVVPIVYQYEEEMMALHVDDSDDDGRSFAKTNGFMGRLAHSLDFFEDNDTLEIPAEERCKEQMICEMSYLMTYVDSLEKIVRTYGMLVPGLRPGYQKAISDGSSRRPCKTPQKEECPNSVLTLLLSVAKAITGEHY